MNPNSYLVVAESFGYGFIQLGDGRWTWGKDNQMGDKFPSKWEASKDCCEMNNLVDVAANDRKIVAWLEANRPDVFKELSDALVDA